MNKNLPKNEKSKIIVNFIKFIKFIKDNNILVIVIATALSERICNILNSFMDDIIMPILNRDKYSDKIEDIKKIENYKINISGINFKVGKFIVSLIKFIIISFILYIIFFLIYKV